MSAVAASLCEAPKLYEGAKRARRPQGDGYRLLMLLNWRLIFGL
jgi:hypothetical protein